jgi:hypothetical protein
MTMRGIAIARLKPRRGSSRRHSHSRLRTRAPSSSNLQKAIRSPGAAGAADAAVAVDDRTRTCQPIRSRLRRATAIRIRGKTRPACLHR